MAPRKKAAAAEDLDIPQSTGAVGFDASPDEWGVTDDNTSTGAVEMPGVMTMTQGYLTDATVINYATPGPTVVTASWLTNAQKKVIESRMLAGASPSGVEAEVKDVEPVDGGVVAGLDVAGEIPADVPADIPDGTVADVQSEVPADVPDGTVAEAPAEPAAEAQ